MTQGRNSGRGTSGRGRGPLVAEKRNVGGATRKPAKKATKTRTPRKAKRGWSLFGRRKTKRAAPRKRGLIGWLLMPFQIVLRVVWAVSWRMGVVGGIFLAGAVAYHYSKLPEYQALLDGRHQGSVTLLDREGKTFAWRGDQFGGVVTADTVSPHLKNAIVATEDKRFYRHFGISPRGIASAVRINLSEGRGPLSGHGGSTITQQTAKLMCLGVQYDPTVWESEAAYESDCRQSSLWRKAKEAIFAMAMEAKYTKNEVLSIYMNRAYMGGGAHGVEAASQRYFGKSANQVNPPEAAMLAGLLTAPSTLAPTNNIERSRNRAATVLRLMEEQGYLSEQERQMAAANPAELSEAAAARAGGYFADWIMDTVPSFLGDQTTEDVVIRTTLDQRLQQAAEDAVTFVFENKVREGSKAQAAVVVMSADGAVRAMVGGAKCGPLVCSTARHRRNVRLDQRLNPLSMRPHWSLAIRHMTGFWTQNTASIFRDLARGARKTTPASTTARSHWPVRCAILSTFRRSKSLRPWGATRCVWLQESSASTAIWRMGRRWRWGRPRAPCWK